MDNTIKIYCNKDRIDFFYDTILSLINTGWKGKWSIDDNIIYINKCVGLTLEQYIKKYDYLDNKSTLHLAICLGIQIDIQDWNVQVIKEDQPTRFYYKISYVNLE